MRLFLFLGTCNNATNISKLIIKDAWKMTTLYEGTYGDFVNIMNENDWREKLVLSWEFEGTELTVGISLN